VVQVEYDPAKVSYEKLLDVFWKAHDPTQINRQGPDVGTQYRSVIFYHTPEQEQTARASKAKLEGSGRFRRPIATQIEPAQTSSTGPKNIISSIWPNAASATATFRSPSRGKSAFLWGGLAEGNLRADC
jgi:hypothetical protein